MDCKLGRQVRPVAAWWYALVLTATCWGMASSLACTEADKRPDRPTDDQPDGQPTDDQPDGQPTDDQPDGQPTDDQPDGQPTDDCSRVISGNGPFSVGVAGWGRGTRQSDGSSVNLSVSFDLYFPHGRVAGEPVQTIYWTDCEPDVWAVVSSGTLDEQLAASVAYRDFSGRLAGNAVSGTIDQNLADPEDDVADFATGDITACSTGVAAPAPYLRRIGTYFLPDETAWFIPSAPLDPTGATATAQVNDVAVAVDFIHSGANELGGRFGIKPQTLFPPGQSVEVSITVRDVLGRDFAMAQPAHQALITTATVTDLTFATEPPFGAYAGDCGNVANGQFLIQRWDYESQLICLLALGEHPAGHVLVQYQLRCAPEWQNYGQPPEEYARLVLYNADSVLATQTIDRCQATPLEADLPATGPVWLGVQLQGPALCPQNLPPGYGLAAINIDEVTFTPAPF